jgi:predicted acylesterase/phospholipase RssA
MLALSSGGDDGAFAAGLLVGWTQTGRRPRFEVVTGVSAGALIAPFAFLGPAYDRQLVAMWTRYGAQDLIVKKPLAAVFGVVRWRILARSLTSSPNRSINSSLIASPRSIARAAFS